MNKPTIRYTGVKSRNPQTHAEILRAQLLLDEYNDEALYEFGETAGFFAAGSKKEVILASFHQMLAAAKKLIQQNGNAKIILDKWISIQPKLRNAALGEDGKITDKATLRTVCRVLKDLALSIDEFNLVRADDNGVAPRISKVIADTAEAIGGQIVKGAGINILGSNLKLTTLSTVTLAWGEGDDATSITLTPTANGPELLKFAWPAALADVADGTKVTISVRIVDETTGIANSATAKAVVVAAA